MKTIQGIVLTVDSKGRQFPTGIEYKLTYPDAMDTQIAYQLLIENFQANAEECKKMGIN